MDQEAPRVFISYSHDSADHKDRVLALAQRLVEDGVDVHFDQYVQGAPEQGWPHWMQHQVEDSEIILVACSPIYKERFDARDQTGSGRGAKWEGAIITQMLYNAYSNRFVPILLHDEDQSCIPLVLQQTTHYRLPGGYEDLYRFITKQPRVAKPTLGRIRKLPTDSPRMVDDTRRMLRTLQDRFAHASDRFAIEAHLVRADETCRSRMEGSPHFQKHRERFLADCSTMILRDVELHSLGQGAQLPDNDDLVIRDHTGVPVMIKDPAVFAALWLLEPQGSSGGRDRYAELAETAARIILKCGDFTNSIVQTYKRSSTLTHHRDIWTCWLFESAWQEAHAPLHAARWTWIGSTQIPWEAQQFDALLRSGVAAPQFAEQATALGSPPPYFVSRLEPNPLLASVFFIDYLLAV